MIDVDELERQANLASGDTMIGVHRDELLFLIGRYRELPDETDEEAAQPEDVPGVRANFGSDSAEQWMNRARKCQAELHTAKRYIRLNRYNFSLFADCPDCHAKAGRDCHGTGHEGRLTAAFAALHRLRGSEYGEGV